MSKRVAAFVVLVLAISLGGSAAAATADRRVDDAVTVTALFPDGQRVTGDHARFHIYAQRADGSDASGFTLSIGLLMENLDHPEAEPNPPTRDNVLVTTDGAGMATITVTVPSPTDWQRVRISVDQMRGTEIAVGAIDFNKPADDACGDLLLIGVRGSGQSATDHGGWGREMFTLKDVVTTEAENSGLDVREMALDYDAAPVSVMLPSRRQAVAFASGPGPVRAHAFKSWTSHRVGKFMSSISGGVSELVRQIDLSVGSCEDRVVGLMGYSQGAMVVHRALVLLAKYNPDELQMITTVGLLADGDRTAQSRQEDLGSASDGARGVAVFAKKANADIPSLIADRTFSFCADNDPVCDTTFRNLFSPGGKNIHTGYAVDQLQELGWEMTHDLTVAG